MAYLRIIAAFFAAAGIGATPAIAGAISVDAPGDIMLFGLGLVGLIVGRQISKRRKHRQPDDAG